MNLLVLKTQLSDVDRSSLGEFVYRTIFRFGSSFLVSVYGFMLKIFWLIAKYVYRSKEHEIQENGSSFKANRSQNHDQVVSKNSRESESNSFAEEKSPESSESKKSKHFKKNDEAIEESVSLKGAIVANTSKYQFISGKNVSGFMEEPKTMKFEMLVGLNEGFVCNNLCLDSEYLRKRDPVEVNSQENLQKLEVCLPPSFEESISETETVDQGKAENPSVNVHSEEIKDEKGNENSAEYKNLKNEGIVSMEVESMEDQDFAYEIELLPENQFSGPKINQDSEDSVNENELLPKNQFSAPETKQHSEDPIDENEMLPANQFSAPEIKQNSEDPGNESEWFPENEFSGPQIIQDSEYPGSEVFPGNQFSGSGKKQDFDMAGNEVKLLPDFLVRTRKAVDKSPNNAFFHGYKPRKAGDVGAINSDEGSDDEYIELEPPIVNSNNIHKESLNFENTNKIEELHEVNSTHNEVRAFVNNSQEDALRNELGGSDPKVLREVRNTGTEVMTFMDNSQEEASNSKSWDSDSEEEDECDILLEHRHLVQQMKMELKNSRIRGLPTISEEGETPKIVEDLKPLQIDLKFEYEDIMSEIQNFYKSYKERMRKLDILNYQTLHAISFLQLKDSEVFRPVKKKSALSLKPTWPMKVQRVYDDPTHKSIVEMHRDLELVYVGQLCLSWEILCWQYVKAKELLKYDSQGFHSYNRVAEEFQQFQVLVQRFMEDEPFQGPRIQNYVKNRCMIRSLLQVPIIEDDCLKDKKARKEETDAISLEMLAEIIKGSMLVFWEFVHSDKGTNTVVFKGVRGAKPDLQEPTNSELIMAIITKLQKKERRLKEIARCQNCLVKKFQKHRECQLNNGLFTSRVELRLVSRVLSLSRLTTDQLVWCHKKLNNINLERRKVHVEPTLLLFTC